MPELSPFEYNVIYNMMSLAVATMMAATAFFFISPRVNPKYRPAMIVTGLVTFIAFYHYWQIRGSFGMSYAFDVAGGTYQPDAAHPFNDFYRYADWLLTVPLLMVELIAVMALARAEASKYLKVLIPAVILMIVLGYPGEAAIAGGGSSASIWGWFVASMIPFCIILFVLFTQLGSAIDKQPTEAQGLIKLARLVVLVTWSFYPIAYVIGAMGAGDDGGRSAGSIVGLQVGYTIADITAKAGFGVLIYLIARRKSELEGEVTGAAQPAVA